MTCWSTITNTHSSIITSFNKFRRVSITGCGSNRFSSIAADLLPFERRPTVLQSFHRYATESLDVAMMFGDDSSEVMMLYDTNCLATVVMPARSERLATLLLLPNAELQPLEECLSNSRMTFWLNNLKPGYVKQLKSTVPLDIHEVI